MVTRTRRIVRTACPSHCGGNACGILAHVEDGRVVKLEPADFPDPSVRRICAKGLALTQLLYHPDRLQHPLKRAGQRGEGKWQRISWDQALDEIAARLKDIAARYGSRSVGWLLGGPGGGTTKFGAYTRFASLFQGTRISAWGVGDAAAPCAGRVTFGAHRPPQFIAFDDPKLNILWGTNPAESRPFSMRKLLDQKEQGVKLVVIDPIFTVTASKADEHISIRPGADPALALGMMNVILSEGLQDDAFMRQHTVGPFLVRADSRLFLREKDTTASASSTYMVWDTTSGRAQPQDAPGVSPALSGSYTVNGIECHTAYQLLTDLISEYPPQRASQITGVPADTIQRLARAYATSRPASIHATHGLGRTYHGDLSFRAVCTLAALTGNIVLPGEGGHRQFELNWDPFLHPKPSQPSYSRLAVLNMYNAITRGEPYPIKAVWFSFINFVNQCANSNRIVNELRPALELVVVADMFMTSTAQYADYVLPVCTFLEHTDLVHGPFPYLQLQQKVIEPLYESKSDISILTELAKRFGFEEFFNKSEEEFVALLLASRHPSVEGITVPRLKEGPAEMSLVPRAATASEVKFHTPSGKMEFYVERLRQLGEELPVHKEPLESARTPLARKYPLVFVQVHSRFRTHSMFANNPWIREINPQPVVEINPADALPRQIANGDMVLVFNDRGRAKLRARLNDGIRPGIVNITQGWWFRDFAEGGFNALTSDAVNPAQNVAFEPNMAMNDVLVEVKKA
ncbi:MAG: molybdopterin-dependent oxidoreductase [Chloroflexota bacterium]